MTEPATATAETPLGRLGVVEEDGFIVRLLWDHEPRTASTPLLIEAIRQLRAYFEGTLSTFDLPLAPTGGAFQRRVCDAMSAIPFGETRTYGELAAELGTSPQPLGNACGANPIPILIPCHRVVAANGLGGFSGKGGVHMKARLLRHENAYSLLF